MPQPISAKATGLLLPLTNGKTLDVADNLTFARKLLEVFLTRFRMEVNIPSANLVVLHPAEQG